MSDSIHHGLLETIEADIRTMIADGELVGISADSVQHRKVPSLRDFKDSPGVGEHSFPGILICPPPTGETWEPRDNANDLMGYPVLVAIAAQDKQDLTANEDRYIGWRQTIIDTYRRTGKTISSPATTFIKCQLEPGPVIDWERWSKDGVFSSWFILRFFTKRQHAGVV